MISFDLHLCLHVYCCCSFAVDHPDVSLLSALVYKVLLLPNFVILYA